jgi:hypothetical protein
MTTISPKIQHEVLQEFLDSFSSEKSIEALSEKILKYNYELLKIQGFFPLNPSEQAEQNQISPQFLSLDGEELDVEHPVHILAFHQQGTEQNLIDLTGLEIHEANLIQLNDHIISITESYPDDSFYYRITFNINQEDPEHQDNIILISFNQIKAYAQLIYGIVNVTSPDENIAAMWRATPLKIIRSELYQYALQHYEISKLSIYIISTKLFVCYELEAPHNELKHQDHMQNIIKPFIHDPLVFSVSPFSDSLDLKNLEDPQISLEQDTILYDKSKWQFWLLNWFRIRQSTYFLNIQEDDQT